MSSASFASLFSGAGGLDLGLEAAGWASVYASDIDGPAVATLRANLRVPSSGYAFPHAHIEQADVRGLRGTDILAKAGLQKGNLPLLVGGPPCQSWSSAGHQYGFLDPRGRLFADFIRLAGELDVRWLMFENVRGLVTARGPDGRPGGALELIRERLLRAGFQTHVALLNAADYGVPQRRVRLFVFGYRTGDALTFPAPTHHKLAHRERSLGRPWVTLGDALDTVSCLAESEIIRPTGKLAEQLEDLPAGTGVKSPGKRESTRPGGHWGYKQGAFIADLLLPARTVTANAQQDWIRDPVLGLRRLCPRECAAVQTFPIGWHFVGARTDQYRMIGNAVPPVLAEAVGRSLLKHLGKNAVAAAASISALSPLAPQLEAAIQYTIRDDARNGESRRRAPTRRVSRAAPSLVAAE
jgi:DNA (cytosine-5)-methyltransferase 1